ncbi:MAG: hypothetical protein E7350_04275 [Clostridiales bacterium]|nr:hypothetical protein [Clostridiales bacterium]
MICQRCNKKEATGYMETTVNGIKKRVYVCPECFKQAQLEMYSSYDDMGLFSGLMGVPGAKAKCSKCGTTLREISDTCFVGCQYCYSEFGDRLKPLLRNLQSAQMHIGSGPDGEKSDEIAELNGRLRKAVEAEDYEQALKIQEMLKKLKGEAK